MLSPLTKWGVVVGHYCFKLNNHEIMGKLVIKSKGTINKILNKYESIGTIDNQYHLTGSYSKDLQDESILEDI